LDGGVVLRERKENRGATERVDDGKERRDNQDAGFDDGQHKLTMKKYTRRSAETREITGGEERAELTAS
jgi:hypothetical protein